MASGYAYKIVRSDGKSWSKRYRQWNDGRDPAAKDFLKSLVVEEEKIREFFKKPASLEMTRQDWKHFNEAKNCWICEKSLWVENFLDSLAVRDPPTGKYCGKSDRKCRWEGACAAFGKQNRFGRLEILKKPPPIAEPQKRQNRRFDREITRGLPFLQNESAP